MKLHELVDFLGLSAALNLQFSAKDVGWENILQIISNRGLPPRSGEREIIRHVLAYLDHAYGPRRRRIGPPAILHPLRATALLTGATGRPQLLDMLTELLHDKYEDLTPENLGRERFEHVESEFRSLLKEIDPTDEWYLMERLERLSLKQDESYRHYISRLLDCARQTEELVRIKLADRLDNTLDLRLDLDDPLEGVNFFQVIFQVLFPPSDPAYQPRSAHPPSSPFNGAQRLYQLCKNSILLSMIREKQVARADPAAGRLFEALALASMNEAQRIALHIMGYHQTDVDKQRALIMEAQGYAQDGGLIRTTAPSRKHPLDGLFSTFFFASRALHSKRLEELYADKELMLQASIAFVVIFLNFAHSPEYWVRGISDAGVEMSGG